VLYQKHYPQLLKEWKGKVYQNQGMMRHKMKPLGEVLHLFKGKKVFEIGCNAAIQSIDISAFAESYIGIEAKKEFYEQAIVTKKICGLNKADYFNCRLEDMIKNGLPDFDTLYASYVLYHLNDEEVNSLKKHILPKCGLVIIFNRDEKRKNEDNRYRLENPKNVEKMLVECGFKVQVRFIKTKGNADNIWRIIGERNDKLQNQGEPKEDKQGTPDSSDGRGAFSNQGRVADNDKSGTVEQQGVAGGENSDIQAVEPEQGDQDILRDRGQKEHEQPQGEKHIQDDAEAIGAEGLPEADTVE